MEISSPGNNARIVIRLRCLGLKTLRCLLTINQTGFVAVTLTKLRGVFSWYEGGKLILISSLIGMVKNGLKNERF